MRFATIELDGVAKWGVVDGAEIALIDRWPSLMDAIAAGGLAGLTVPADARRVPLADAVWLPLIPAPNKIICVGLNYENHRKETGRAVVENPTIFTRFADSQTGHLSAIVLPPESDRLDYEGEMAVVIGRGGRRIPAAQALDHVAGYSCYNDGSIRDWQAHTIQFTPGKNWPETGAFGPWMVTPDEFGAIGPQRLQTRLNGQVMQDALLSDMIFPVDRLIEYVSTFTPLSPGDVIVSGTPGGVGNKRDPQVFMKEGDRVEIEIDGIGTLVNSIARRP
ncbi:fumarylacetoacetate hydrolase family protein [Sphingomonas sp. AOB5]|uniref:fumarylacetoacetate hydrolase family protein n=1 Tax=Sphingomonas sp. AOB5 TaxID=3034017 RepID=UPI0023F69AA4|nr:fumarylacetoacetate hydrolase family protein [Sphingomonas sp. AOB5]MDF7776458.1 fumarylacetoacetate hydrolase family protein [Sphingomonas sp. AOB5]